MTIYLFQDEESFPAQAMGWIIMVVTSTPGNKRGKGEKIIWCPSSVIVFISENYSSYHSSVT